MLSSIIMWIGIGVIAGLLARLSLANANGQHYGLGGTVSLGIFGAILGGWIGQQTFLQATPSEYNVSSLFMAFVGAVIVVAFLRLMDRRHYVA